MLNFYLILEYIPNGELFEIINKYRPLSEDVARFLICEIICGLKFIHMFIDDCFYRLLNIDNILFVIQNDNYITQKQKTLLISFLDYFKKQ